MGVILQCELEYFKGGVRGVAVKDQGMRLVALHVVGNEVVVYGGDDIPQDWLLH